MLLCLTTAQRGQTIYSLDVNYIQAFDDKYRITVMYKLKPSKPGAHLEPIVLHAFREDKKLCVFEHLKKPSFHMLGKSQTIRDFAVSRPSQILPTNEKHKS